MGLIIALRMVFAEVPWCRYVRLLMVMLLTVRCKCLWTSALQSFAARHVLVHCLALVVTSASLMLVLLLLLCLQPCGGRMQ
jgi:hypothetical protein